MQKVYIPSELLPDTPEWPKKAQADAEGNPVLNSSTHKPVLTADDNTDWLRVKSFTFTYGATQIKLVYDAGKKAWLIQNGLHPGDYLTWQQLKDRGIVSTDKLAAPTRAATPSTSRATCASSSSCTRPRAAPRASGPLPTPPCRPPTSCPASPPISPR